jgi:hypothetical protein
MHTLPITCSDLLGARCLQELMSTPMFSSALRIPLVDHAQQSYRKSCQMSRMQNVRYLRFYVLAPRQNASGLAALQDLRSAALIGMCNRFIQDVYRFVISSDSMDPLRLYDSIFDPV